MNALALEATEFTPKVVLDHVNYLFEIKGESSPEDARQFYSPLIKWVEDFGNYLHYLNSKSEKSAQREVCFQFHLDYVTSSSLKNIYDLLQKIEALRTYSDKLKVKWVYDADDEDMQDNGQEFSKMLKVPFEIVSA
jgi:hypothetical protein